jgi:hypothetical protein
MCWRQGRAASEDASLIALAGAGYGLYYYTRKKDARNQLSFEK